MKISPHSAMKGVSKFSKNITRQEIRARFTQNKNS